MIDSIDDILGKIENADDDFIRDIKKYWCIITSYEDFEGLIQAPIKEMKKKFTKVPEVEWEAVIKEFNIPAMEGDFINQFMHFFTHDDLKSLIDLYENHPVLKKASEKNKQIRDDTYKLTVKWMDNFNSLMMKKLDEWEKDDLL